MRLRRALAPLGRRLYHDDSFGYRKARDFLLPDYTPAQLENRSVNAALLRYVDSMRLHGHRAARIDPLDLLERDDVAALDPARYGLTDPEQEYDINGIVWVENGDQPTYRKLKDITHHLHSVYVGNIAYEYMHSPSKRERLWFSRALEGASRATLTANEQKRLHALLARSEIMDRFLQLKFPNLKRYGLEGGESMLPAIDALFRVASKNGVDHVVLGMPHRGRLNLLTEPSLLNFPADGLFSKIKGNSELPIEYGAEGDVLSHLFNNPTLRYERDLKVSLLPNPSHLEAVTPVSLGVARAKQYSLIKTELENCNLGDKVMCLQIHGDASFTGQGVVMETLGLSNLPHYTTGGSVHLVVNNSIGYTTPAATGRSSLYCSDIGKMVNAPVLHVNGDHPEDVVRAVEVAYEYRNHFRKDIIIDLMVYRRWGHNELDEPSLTQPLMYKKIRSRKSVPEIYEDKLVDEQVLDQAAIDAVRTSYKSELERHLSNADSYVPAPLPSTGPWSEIVFPSNSSNINSNPQTGATAETLKEVGLASVTIPEGFEIHSRLQRHVKQRVQSLESGEGINWATAEAMAFGSLMSDGYDVRISGQDVGRGTFSHRHAMFVHQSTENVIVPLNTAKEYPGRLELANSSLSEMAVLAFEVGQSWERPNLLPIWEAQFGDFFNGAQVIFDTYISSSETKWLKQIGLVVLLPHGLDGAGPEHSSSRIERMLQLTNDPYTDTGKYPNVNMHVVFPTTPAQYFHLLRRQMKRNFRKPLIVAAPKGLLRLPAAASQMSEFTTGTSFKPVLADSTVTDPNAVKRVVLLSGKLYYDLVKDPRRTSSVAFVRIEELAPFPFAALREVLDQYPNASEHVWLQEEPKNQGAYEHVAPRIRSVIGKDVEYHGRKESAVPAPGIGKMYAAQQKAAIDSAFEGL